MEVNDQSTFGQAKEQAHEMAQEAKGQAGRGVRDQVDRRSKQAGEQVSNLVEAFRRTGEQLRSEGREGPAKLVDQLAQRGDRLGMYLKDSNGDRILDDVERLARKQPWALAAGAFAVALLASRVLKASSRRRYESADGVGKTGNWGAIGYSTGPALGQGGTRDEDARTIQPATAGQGVTGPGL